MPSQSKILFVDDHEGLRDGMGTLLSQKNPMFSFVYASNKAEAVVTLQENSEIQTAIVDLNLDGERGLDLIVELHAVNPNLNVLVYSMYSDEMHIAQACRAGIHGYVSKDAKIEELSAALNCVSQGLFCYNKTAGLVLQKLIQNNKEKGSVSSGNVAYSELIQNYKTLTKKEQEIFMLIAQGNSVSQISELLKKSEKTVINQRTVIYSKMNISDRLDLQNAAKLLGIIV